MDKSLDIRSRTGGAYIPPAKLRLMQQQISDKNSEQYQRLAWETLKKSINGLINKVNVGNIATIVKELFEINLIRGRGMLVRSLIRAQISSPTFTHVYAALIAVCNTKFPKIGELLLKRLIIQFRRYFQRNDKANCINTTRFIAHLVNQQIAHEVIALEILILLLENATNDSVEVAIAFLKECGSKLDDVSRKGATAIFERLRNILHDGELNKRVQYMIEVMFAVRKDKFKDHPAVLPELDLIEESDQFTHLMTLEDELDSEDRLNVFQFDEKFQENEAKYAAIKKDILDADSDDDSSDDEEGDDEDSDNDEEESGDDDKAPKMAESSGMMIIDNTETNLITLRKTIYLTIQSSLDFEECAHKLLKLEIQQAQYPELCNMIVDCCAQQRTYIKFFGLLAQRFCMLNHDYVEPFKDIFKNCYDTIHRFETCKLRNVAKLFAHLLHTDALPWTVLAHIKLNEYDTTSSSRVFIKILFQQLAESLGLVKLNGRIKDATLQEAFDGLFPRDNPQNTRFAINFFTSIGLGGLTDDLREHLKTVANQKPTVQLLATSAAGDSKEDINKKIKKESSSDDSSDSSSSSSSSSSDSDDEDSDSSSSSDDSQNRHKIKSNQRHDNHSSSKSHRRSNENDRNRSSSSKYRHEIKEEDFDDEEERSSYHRQESSSKRRTRDDYVDNSERRRNRHSDSIDNRHLKERNNQRDHYEPDHRHRHPKKSYDIKEEIVSDFDNRRSHREDRRRKSPDDSYRSHRSRDAERTTSGHDGGDHKRRRH